VRILEEVKEREREREREKVVHMEVHNRPRPLQQKLLRLKQGRQNKKEEGRLYWQARLNIKMDLTKRNFSFLEFEA
jgi:hypothetical protein